MKNEKTCQGCNFVGERYDRYTGCNVGYCTKKKHTDIYFGIWQGKETEPKFGEFIQGCKYREE